MSTIRLSAILQHCLVPQPIKSTSGRTCLRRLATIHTSSKMSSRKIDFPSGNSAGACPGVIFGDAGKTKKGLIVLQEWWGMNQQIQDRAEELAEMGPFVTLVPDLYRGKVAQNFEEAGHYSASLDWPGAVQDISGAANFLKGQGCTKVGVTGFCMGGALTLLAAAQSTPEVHAAAPFYGIPRDELADLRKIKIPIQCHFGEQDVVPFCSPENQQILIKKLKEGGVDYEFHSYEAGHAFTNKTSATYNEKCSKIALERLVAFMNEKLQ